MLSISVVLVCVIRDGTVVVGIKPEDKKWLNRSKVFL